MVKLLLERVEGRGDEPAIVDEFTELTWREVNERQNRLVDGLRGLGLGVGDTVAVLGNNRHEWMEAVSAGLTAGLVVVPINWHFSVDEIAYVLENSGAVALVADVEFADRAVAAAEQAQIPIRIAFGGPLQGFTDFEEVIGAGSADEPAEEVAGATMLYTSGTTGRPKGVKSTLQSVGGDPQEGMERIAMMMQLFHAPVGGGVVLCNAPLYHGGPLLFGGVPFMLGATLILRRKWDAEETLRLIDEHEVSFYYAVPTHFARLLKMSEAARSGFSGASLRYVIHTAAPCPPDVKRQMIEWWGPVIYELYGATESSALGTVVSSEEWLAKPGTVGKPTAICEIAIVGEDGRELGPNESGQICVRNTLGLDFEYLGDEEKTSKAHLAPGTITFGDIGYVDDDGFLFLSDRKIDMIISGGVNIYPAEIEAALMTHPAVADAGVFGIPNDEYGEEVKAAVELVDGTDPATVEADLKRLCREKLAGYMVPRSFDFGELPRTPTGKLQKKDLRAPYWEGTGRTI